MYREYHNIGLFNEAVRCLWAFVNILIHIRRVVLYKYFYRSDLLGPKNPVKPGEHKAQRVIMPERISIPFARPKA